jgi:hypothetical protein
MFHLDHFGIFARNHNESTFRLSRETGLGCYDGGYFPNYGVGIRIIPFGNDTFLEIQSLTDLDVIKKELASPGILGHALAKHREAFMLWSFRTDSEAELEEFSRVTGQEIDREVLNSENAQQMMNGDKIVVIEAPNALISAPLGMPNVYFWPDMSKHDSRYPVEIGTGRRTPQGLAWVEVGGTPEEFDGWFKGLTVAKDHPLRFNGRAPGLHAIGVKTDKGEVSIRRPTLLEDSAQR